MTRNNVRKVLGQTVQLANNICGKQNLLHSFPVVGTTKSSSTNNNYSTKAKKENFINIPKQLHNNNKLMNILVHDFKNYSSSSINSNNNTIHVLNPVQYKTWSQDEVCSLLCSPEENGGAGLTIEKVKPLYDAGFDGTSLGNIVTHIQDKDKYFAAEHVKQNKDYQNISQTTLEIVVNWVDNLLKTRLYHLWSKEDVCSWLCTPKENGGAGLTIKDVQLLDAGFKDINPINRYMNMKHDPSRIGYINQMFLEIVPTDPKITVANWAEQLLQNKLTITLQQFHLKTLKDSGLTKLDALSLEVTETTNNSYTYTIDGKKEIFSNVKDIANFEATFVSCQNNSRGRPSIEVLGQVRTGKTTTSRYIIPYILAKLINKQRIEKELPPLDIAPVFYVRFNSKENPKTMISDSLEPLRTVVNYKGKGITNTVFEFRKHYPNSHIFIVLDEVQVLKSTDLDSLRETIKSRDYNDITFILTGSTQGRFLRILDMAVKNGLSYDEATVKYSVPPDNTKDELAETFKFHGQELSDDQKEDIKYFFGCINCATVSQLIQIMAQNEKYHEKEKLFDVALKILLREIFSIYDRDILDNFSNPLSKSMYNLISKGRFRSVDVYNSFFDTYLKYYVTVGTEQDKEGNSFITYSFIDKHLKTYLLMRLKRNNDGKYVLSPLPEITNVYDLLIWPLQIFGERIQKCQTNPSKYQSSYSEIKIFLKRQAANLTDEDIDNLCVQLKTKKCDSQKSESEKREQKLENIFIGIRNTLSHQSNTTSSASHKIIAQLISQWFKEKQVFYLFLHSVNFMCAGTLKQQKPWFKNIN